jgi:hypothetical protein
MADFEKELRIKITTAADTGGFQKTSDATKQLKADLTGLTNVNGSYKSASEIADEAQNKQAKSADRLHESHRGVERALRSLTSSSIPELGEALGSLEAFGPEIAGAIALGIAVKATSEYLGEAAKKATELREAAAELDINIWHAQRDAIKEAGDMASDYLDRLNAIPDAMKKISDAESDQLKILQAQADAQLKILDAQEKREKASATTPQQVAEIEQRYGHRKTDSELSGEEAQIIAQTQQLNARRRAADALKRKSDSDAAALGSAASDPAAAADKARMQAAIKERDDLKKKLDEDVAGYKGTHGEKGTTDSVREEIAAADEAGQGTSEVLETSRELINKYDAAQNKVAALTDATDQSANELKTLKAKAEASAKAWEDNKTAMDALNRAIEEQTSLLGIHRDTARKVNVEEYSKPGAVENVMAGAINAITDAHAGQFTDTDKNAIENLKKLLSIIGLNGRTVIEALSVSKDLHRDQASETNYIKKELEELRRTISQTSQRNSSPIWPLGS